MLIIVITLYRHQMRATLRIVERSFGCIMKLTLGIILTDYLSAINALDICRISATINPYNTRTVLIANDLLYFFCADQNVALRITPFCLSGLAVFHVFFRSQNMLFLLPPA